MTTRTITVTLTEAQYMTLASAVAVASADWDAQMPDRYFSIQMKVLDTAWRKINHAWHGRARHRVKRSPDLGLAPEVVTQDREALR